ncbi:MAG: YeeE/YedE family protein [Rhodospirillales bacterium]|nr:YeeE/YedE family protein [Rhodospirillales bacterium]
MSALRAQGTEDKNAPQYVVLTAALGMALGLFMYVLDQDGKLAILFVLGLGMGMTLLYGSYGFSGAYRKFLVERDMTGIVAQLLMLGIAIVLFAPVLAQGTVFDRGVTGSLAPVGVSVAFGAFIFGIGMQVAGGCASGTLYTVGGGNPRMVLVLLFFCVGAFWGSVDLGWWQTLPSFGTISLGRQWGWGVSVIVQLGVLGLIYVGLRLGGWKIRPGALWGDGLSLQRILRGPWPLVLAACMLALLNWATLLTTGHGWSITWAFSLWAAKGAVLMGWDPLSSSFWAGGFQFEALNKSILLDETSVMDIGILIGALAASALAGSYGKGGFIKVNAVIAAIAGGLLMGYGARLAYGCNIGAFFSGVASGSLHGWLWIVCALPGNGLGLLIRKRLGL